MFGEVKSVVLFNHSGDLMHIKYLHLSHRQAVFKMYSFAKSKRIDYSVTLFGYFGTLRKSFHQTLES